MAGILYVIFNKAIRDPETNEILYKIGITNGKVEDRYYGLGLKMPGKFEILFAYLLENYKQAERFFHNLFSQYRNNGEWFNLEKNHLDLIESNCKAMGGEDVKNKVEIEKEPIQKIKPKGSKKNEKTVEELSNEWIEEIQDFFIESLRPFLENNGRTVENNPRNYIKSPTFMKTNFHIHYYAGEMYDNRIGPNEYIFQWTTNREDIVNLREKIDQIIRINDAYRNAFISPNSNNGRAGIYIQVEQNNVEESVKKIIENTWEIIFNNGIHPHFA